MQGIAGAFDDIPDGGRPIVARSRGVHGAEAQKLGYLRDYQVL